MIAKAKEYLKKTTQETPQSTPDALSRIQQRLLALTNSMSKETEIEVTRFLIKMERKKLELEEAELVQDSGDEMEQVEGE